MAEHQPSMPWHQSSKSYDEVDALKPFQPGELSWRHRITYAAHLFKALVKQHHKELIPVLRAFVPPDAVVFDVGAHAGQFAKLFARLAPRGRIYAFEPGSYARNILERAIRFNRLANVTIVPAGLGDGVGQSVLAMPIKASGSYGFGLSHLGAPDDRLAHRRERISVTTIDSFAARIDLQRLDFLKADIEGWEVRMIEGGRETLTRLRPVLMLELLEHYLARAGDSLADAWAILSRLGYHPAVPDEAGRLRDLTEPQDGNIFWIPR